MAVTYLSRQLSLPPERSSVRQARRWLGEVLTASGHEDWVDDAQLAISEVVTNVVLHARTDCDLSCEIGPDGARVTVRDYEPTLPIGRHFAPDASTGRGLSLVARLCAQVGVESLGGEGKTVWFLIDGATRPADPQPQDEWDLTDLLAAGEDEMASATSAVLVQVPTALWMTALEHQAAMLRELYLLRAQRQPPTAHSPADLAAANEAFRALSTATDRALRAAGSTEPALAPDPTDPQSPPGPPRVLDVEVPLDRTTAQDFGRFQDVLDQAMRLAVTGLLLQRAPLPEVVQLRDWACHQVVAQCAGVPATAWQAPPPESDVRPGALDRVQDWDSSVVTTSPYVVVAADDTNRVIALSPAATELLGWPAADLVGRRLTTLIPSRYREQHVVGFTRHLSTGQTRVIGVPLDLPVLHADGTETTHRFHIERAPGPGSTLVFLAWLDRP